MRPVPSLTGFSLVTSLHDPVILPDHFDSATAARGRDPSDLALPTCAIRSAELLQRAVSHPLKVAACPHRPACPGCPRFGSAALAPDAAKTLQRLAELGGLAAPLVHRGAPLGFRYRARLAIRGRAKNPKLGIFRIGTHQVVHIPHCPIHHPAINSAAQVIRSALVQHGVAPYSDSAHAGSVRYLQLVVERRTGRVQVVVVTRDDDHLALAPFFATLVSSLGDSLQGLFWNIQPERSNAILGPEFRHLAGETEIREDFAGARLFFPPGAFGQSHLDLAERIALGVAEACPRGARVAEFYSGVGALGLPLVRQVSRLTCNEISDASIDGLQLGIRALEPELAERVQLRPGSAGSATDLLGQVDLVIVDPPRKGLDRALLEGLLRIPPARLVYVSCGLDALVREAQELLSSQLWQLSRLEAYDLFPYTEHVETLAIFDRRGAHGSRA
ncbi:MAG TPA: hypothetical protein VFQ61_23840 [Polyangiaceae bacterium]|nr:hypothetical protein [Polyangiaceae bacterium]